MVVSPAQGHQFHQHVNDNNVMVTLSRLISKEIGVV